MLVAVMKIVVGMTTVEAHERFPEHTESATSSQRCDGCRIRVWTDGCLDRHQNLLVACPNCDTVSTARYSRLAKLTTQKL